MNWSQKKILVVEDDDDLREVMVSVFDDLGSKVFEAADGKIALSILEKEKIDLVCSDIQMPNLDGIDLLKEIRKKSELPFVFFATGQARINEEESLNLGASGLIKKPFEIDTLVSRLEKILSL